MGFGPQFCVHLKTADSIPARKINTVGCLGFQITYSWCLRYFPSSDVLPTSLKNKMSDQVTRLGELYTDIISTSATV